MPFLTVFGIKNGTISAVVELIILFLVVVWLALIYWTYADARRRIADSLLVGCATAASLFPFVGTIVYMIVRPPEYLDDVRERELEIQAAEARLAELGYQVCPYCDYEVEKDFLRCPNCMRKLKDPCTACGKPLDPMWKICPFCEAEVAGAAPQPRRTRRRRESAPEPPVAGRPCAPSAARPRRRRRARRARRPVGHLAAPVRPHRVTLRRRRWSLRRWIGRESPEWDTHLRSVPRADRGRVRPFRVLRPTYATGAAARQGDPWSER